MTKQDIIQLYKNKKYNSIKSDNEIWSSFINTINNPRFKLSDGTSIPSANIDSLIDRLIAKYNYNKSGHYKGESIYPLYISYLIVLILPLVDIEENTKIEGAKGYYPRAKEYFDNNNIKYSTKDLDTVSFRRICSSENGGEIDVWSHLDKWSKSNDLGFYTKPIIQRDGGNNRYVKTVFSQALISESEVSRLRLLFAALELPTGLHFSDNEIIKFYKYDASLNIVFRGNTNKRALALDIVKDNLIAIFRNEYQKWDGKTYTAFRNQDANMFSEVIEDNGTIYNIYLSLRLPSKSENHQKIDLRYRIWYKNAFESPETISFKVGKIELKETYLLSDGWSDDEYDLGSIEEKKILKDDGNNIKAIYQPRNIILFQKLSNNTWTSKAIYEKGRNYYILISKKETNILAWLEQNAELTEYTYFSSHLLYKITDAKSSCPEHNVLMLKEVNLNDIVISYNNNIKIYSDRNKIIFSNQFSISFDIVGITKDYHVYAEFDRIERKRIELFYEELGNTWLLKDNLNHNLYKNDEFKVVIRLNDNIIKESSIKYSFSSYSISSSLHDSLRNKYGEFIENQNNAISEGLELFKGNTFAPTLRFANNQSIKNNTKYFKEDHLLYALSSIKKMNKKDFNDLVTNIILKIKSYKRNNEENYFQRFRFDILNEYDRLGYLNYDYYNKEHIITVNRPTIILLPVRHKKIIEDGLTKKEPIDSGYRAILIGARTVELVLALENLCRTNDIFIEYQSIDKNILLPQQIILHTQKLDQLDTVANKLNILFQKDKVFADSLFQNIPSIEEYTNEILKEENEINEYPSDTRSYQNIKCLDYKGNLDGKNNFDPELDLVTYSPDSYEEKTILWYKNKQYPVDKYWGYFVIMFLLGIKHIEFDSECYILRIPSKLRFPRIYARAFSLISDERSRVEIYNNNLYRRYQLTNCPYNGAILGEKILEKLNQNI